MSRDRQVVVGRCDGKQRCQVPVNHEVFSEDPCPNIGKYLEVAYRCRPGKQRLNTKAVTYAMITRFPYSM